MAVNLDAIRKRIQELNGERNANNSSIQLWKPGVGEYKVRGIPWKNAEDGVPLISRYFYYLGNEKRFLAPYQFGKPDPINDLRMKLFKTKSPDDKELAKKLFPKPQTYMAIIVRGQEEQGPIVWALGKQLTDKMLSYWLDEEVGDILDPESGFDIKVHVVKDPRPDVKWCNVDVAKTGAMRNSSKLHADPEQVKKWLDAVPNLDEMYQQKSNQEVETILARWLNDGAPTDRSDGTPKGPAAAESELDKIAEEVKAGGHSVPKAEAAKPVAAKKPVPKKPVIDDDDDVPVKSTSSGKIDLDAAFAELENE